MSDDLNIPLLFQGEEMHCVMCGRVQKSDPKVESNWTCLQVETRLYYVCPLHLPLHNRAKASDFERAYEKIFRKIAELEKENNA